MDIDMNTKFKKVRQKDDKTFTYSQRLTLTIHLRDASIELAVMHKLRDSNPTAILEVRGSKFA